MTHARARRRPRLVALIVGVTLVGVAGVGTLPAAAAPSPTPTPAPTPRIVGGTPVGKTALPALAAIMIDDPTAPVRSNLVCSGAVIAQQWVLTAGHCSEVALFGLPLMVQVGSRDLGGTAAIKVPVDSVVVNRTFFNKGPGSDVSIFHLTSPVTVPLSVLATTADTQLTAAGVNVTTAGWGFTKKVGLGEQPRGLPAKRAHSLSLPLIDDATCTSVFADISPKYFVPATDLCAGSEGKSPCFGDSGGPMYATNATGGLVQIGVTSRGAGCATKLFPGIFTDVFALRDWITKFTAKPCKRKVTIDLGDPEAPPAIPLFVC